MRSRGRVIVEERAPAVAVLLVDDGLAVAEVEEVEGVLVYRGTDLPVDLVSLLTVDGLPPIEAPAA